MKNSSYNFENISQLQDLIDDSIIDSPKMLIQLFCAKNDLESITELHDFFKENFPKSHLIGSSTDGIIEGDKVYFDSKNVVSFTVFTKSQLKTYITEYEDNFNDSYESGVLIAKTLVQANTKVIISFADGILTNGEEYVKGINSIAPDVVLSGGLAGDNGLLKMTYVFDKEKIISGGAVAVSITSEHLNVSTSYSFDWMPIGKKMRVTKAIKNRIYEIDNMPVVEIYAKYMGHDLAHKLPHIGIEFPLIFIKDGVSVGRAVLLKHDDGSLTFAGNIAEGTLVRFGVGSIENILNNSDYNTRKILDSMQYKSEAVFIYSCMARRRFMGKYIQEELGVLSHVGDISGFFTYGEFYHANRTKQLLNETMTVLALSESTTTRSFPLEDSIEVSCRIGVDPQHVIAHLANTVSQELEELNDSLEKRVKESAEYIYKQAYNDKLTGLPNRLSLIQRVTESIGKMIVLINIDDFTTINDFYGHEIGDIVLVKLSKILQRLVRMNGGEVFKLPSDEFAIIMERTYSDLSMQDRIIGCIAAIEAEEFTVQEGHLAHVAVTVAAALINSEKTGLINADMTLKLAKKAGLNYMIFNEDLKLAKQYEENIKMANIIKDAIVKGNIIPYFQPIVDVQTQKIIKYEALVRLCLDEKVLSPFTFLETSQKIKLYPQITAIMIEKTFAYFAKKDMGFSINISFSDILDEQTRDLLFEKIEKYGIAAQLTIEILETMSNDNEKLVNKFIDKVYKSGAKIAIDDFGSGYANFEHMTGMRSDFMKIDGSLIKNIDKDMNARLVVETIIVFARKLGKKIIAEYVHSAEVFNVVKELDIDYAQGYYFGKPQATIS